MAPRNLVPRPAFRAGDPADVSPWVGNQIGQAGRTDSPTGARMAWVGNAARVPLGFTYEPGAQFYVTATLWVSSASKYELFIAPGDVPYGDADSKLPLGLPSGSSTSITYSELTGTLTAGPLSGFYDPHGNPVTVDDGQEAWLHVMAKQNNGALALIRLDYSPPELDGYFDGDDPDTAEWSFSWDGTPRISTSTATSLVEPDPGDPGDGDPDPGDGDPDPGDPDPGDGDPGDGDPDPGDGDPDPGDPDPGDPWDEWDELAARLAPRVAAFVGRHEDPDTLATALAQLPVVAEYVRGYTRGHGFEATIPAPALRAVMVSGTARLATNPEQVAHFQTGDYSERPAQLAGWTLTELGILRRYRRVTA